MAEDFAKQYAALAKSYKLPAFAELDREFGLGSDCSGFPLRDVREKIAEKLGSAIELLESIVSPEHRIADLHENKFISEAERKRAWEIFRLLMAIQREHARLSIISVQDEDAKFIATAWQQWLRLKQELAKIAEKMRDSWNEETDSETDIGYVG
jgi:hypothetical protein